MRCSWFYFSHLVVDFDSKGNDMFLIETCLIVVSIIWAMLCRFFSAKGRPGWSTVGLCTSLIVLLALYAVVLDGSINVTNDHQALSDLAISNGNLAYQMRVLDHIKLTETNGDITIERLSTRHHWVQYQLIVHHDDPYYRLDVKECMAGLYRIFGVDNRMHWTIDPKHVQCTLGVSIGTKCKLCQQPEPNSTTTTPLGQLAPSQPQVPDPKYPLQSA